MPIFDYICLKCNKKESRLIKRSEMDEQVCKCDNKSKMEKLPTFGSNFILKGNWYKNGGY